MIGMHYCAYELTVIIIHEIFYYCYCTYVCIIFPMRRCAAFAATATETETETAAALRPDRGDAADFSAAAHLQASKAELMQQLNSFASDGLRTLVVAKRVLSRSTGGSANPVRYDDANEIFFVTDDRRTQEGVRALPSQLGSGPVIAAGQGRQAGRSSGLGREKPLHRWVGS